MPSKQPIVEYHVTVSAELYALLKARKSGVGCGEGDLSGESPDEYPKDCEVPEGVFSDLRLRVDGQRPKRLDASPIFGLDLTMPSGSADKKQQAVFDHNSLTIYLTRGGECVAHAVCKPGSGRPVYRCAILSSPDDVMTLVRSVRSDIAAQHSNLLAVTEEQECLLADPGAEVLQAHLIERMAPFFENPSNGRL